MYDIAVGLQRNQVLGKAYLGLKGGRAEAYLLDLQDIDSLWELFFQRPHEVEGRDSPL